MELRFVVYNGWYLTIKKEVIDLWALYVIKVIIRWYLYYSLFKIYWSIRFDKTFFFKQTIDRFYNRLLSIYFEQCLIKIWKILDKKAPISRNVNINHTKFLQLKIKK